MASHLAPVPEPFAEDAARLLRQYPQSGGYILTLFRTFANSVRFLQKGVPNLLDRDSPLPLRAREMVILRVTANNDCEYEWGVHVAIFAEKAGLGPGQIEATRLEDGSASCWSTEDAWLLAAVDELGRSGRLQPATQAAFESAWSLEQQLEIMALCGAYQTISYVANTAKLEPEFFAAAFPRRE